MSTVGLMAGTCRWLTVVLSWAMKVFAIALCASALVLVTGASFAYGRGDQSPGTVRYSWVLRLPEKGQEQVFVRKFRDGGGLLRRVSVLIGGRAVPSVPHVGRVGCVKQPPYALAQKTSLWDGQNVFVDLLLMPGKCDVAGTLVRARVILTTVGS